MKNLLFFLALLQIIEKRGEEMNMGNILIKDGLIFDIDKNDLIYSDILIRGRKIEKICANIDYQSEGLKIIDAKDKYIFPGFIDCHTHVGIIEEGIGLLGLDDNEKSNPVTPHIRGIDSINPQDIAFKDAVQSGITAIMVTPGSNNAVGGLNLAIKTAGTVVDKMILKNPTGFKMAFGEEPMNAYGIKKERMPFTRMGIAALIRDLFMRAQDYMANKENRSLKYRDISLEAVIPLLKNEIPLRVHAHRADDIITAIRITEEFGIKNLVIEHGTEAHLIKDYIKEKNVAIAYGPVLTPRLKMELNERDYAAAGELIDLGIKLALITDHPYNTIDQLRDIGTLVVAEGVKEIDAIKALTVHPAEILDCADRVGKLKEGFDADIVIYDDKPLNFGSEVLCTIIDGAIAYSRDNKL